jgi:hypothetical protein
VLSAGQAVHGFDGSHGTRAIVLKKENVLKKKKVTTRGYFQ